MPDALHAHLIISHLPVMGVLFGILLLLWGFLRRNDEVKRVSLALFVISAIGAAVALTTGEAAEDHVESLAGVSGAVVERHEEAAKLATTATYVLGGASLAGMFLLWKFKASGVAVIPVVLILSLVAGVLLARAANLGGQIRHPEIAPAGFPLVGDVDD